MCTKRSDTSKRHRRANNKSRLYEDEKRLFEDIMKHKNNQSLDTKIEKTGHLKYTTLLSKDKNLNIEKDPTQSKGKDVKTNKYFSAPVSTKENGLVTKFKFHDKESKEDKLKVTPNLSPREETKEQPNDKPSEEDQPIIDYDLPINEDIQKIFSNTVNSPSEKVVHMSVINSMDNFEEEKKASPTPPVEELSSDLDPSIIKNIQMLNPKSKAAVPILDFKKLSPKPKPSEYSDSIGSIFEQESHLDLSSKRLKKLILTSDFSSLINLREEALKTRVSKEQSKIDEMLNKHEISPRAGEARRVKLEKWVTKEREEIKKTKKVIEEARRKTEDVIRDTEKNGEFLKQIITDKVTTPREGCSVRSGMNSSRRQYEKMQKLSAGEDGSEKSKGSESQEKYTSGENEGDQLDELLKKYANKEIDMTTQKDAERNSDLEGLVSVETPKDVSNQDSSFVDDGVVKVGPQDPEGDTSQESLEPHFDKNRPINISSQLEPEKSDNEEYPEPQDGSQGLSRKKSEQHLKDIKTKLAPKVEDPGYVDPSPNTPFNSDHFFTQKFDEMEMEDAIEQLKNSSGKMGKDDFHLIKEVEKNKITKPKESRNLNIKQSKKNDPEEKKDLGDSDKKRYYGINDDVEFLRKGASKPNTDDSRNSKRIQSQNQRSSNDSGKEDIILEDVSDKALSDQGEKDPNQIVGSRSLDDPPIETPEKLPKENDLESSEKTDVNNSDSKYATVSILSEMNKKDPNLTSFDPDQTQDESLEVQSGEKLTDLI